jgi:hypothetical protein
MMRYLRFLPLMVLALASGSGAARVVVERGDVVSLGDVDHMVESDVRGYLTV